MIHTQEQIADAFCRFKLDQKPQSALSYEGEAQINRRLGFDISHVLYIYQDNTVEVFAGHRGQEESKEESKDPPEYNVYSGNPQSAMENEMDGCQLISKLGSRVMVVRNCTDFANTIRILDPVRLYVQIWIDAGVMSALSVSNITDDRIVIVIGGLMFNNLKTLIDMSFRLGFRVYVWSSDDTPNTFNLRDTFERSGLSQDALPRQTFHADYQPNSFHELVTLSITNTQLVKDLLLKSRQGQTHRLVSIGMSEYRIPICPATDHYLEDESWCPRPMVRSFLDLQGLI